MNLPRKPGIYLISSLTTGKVYVGQSINVRKRIQEHTSALKRKGHPNTYLQRAWDLYGAEDFVARAIEIAPIEQLLAIEQYWINKYKSYLRENGFNLSAIANTQTGIKRSDETKARMSIALRGKKRTEEQKKHISLIQTGKKLTEQHKRNIAEGNKKRAPHSAESKAKMSLAATGRKMSPEARAKMSSSKKALFAARKNGGNDEISKSDQATNS